MIGEPIIKRKLEQLFEKKFKEDITEMKKYYEKKLKELEKNAVGIE